METEIELARALGRIEGKLNSFNEGATRINRDIIEIRDFAIENKKEMVLLNRDFTLLTNEVKALNNVDIKLADFANKWGLNKFSHEEFTRGMRRLKVLSKSKNSKSILAKLLNKQTKFGYVTIIASTLLLALAGLAAAITEYIQLH